MIRNLYIKNFILMDELNLEFNKGFSAFTGETGAGKSILIDAISLLCAERASASFVMKGQEKAIIEGAFDLHDDQNAKEVLKDAGFEINDITVFTREISSTGKSTARIDHRIAPLSLIRKCLANQIDIHGQRDNAYLLNASCHIHLLDEYLGCSTALKSTKEAYRVYKSLLKEKEEALKSEYNESDLEYFRYQIKEIEDANLKVGEDEELEAQEKRYNAIKFSYDKLNSLFELYENSLSSDLYELYRAVSSLKGEDSIDSIQNQVRDAYYNLTDAMSSLEKEKEDMDLSEDVINAMEERLFILQKLKRKYGGSIEDILHHKEELVAQVERFTDREEYLKKMDHRIAEARKNYDTEAAVLHSQRISGAPEMDRAVIEHLRILMLENARFHTEISASEPSQYGSDSVEFMISMNKNEDLKPLRKTASGGELSRLMLGLKVIFTHLQGISTVIFDEIDTGVSGAVANAIGKEMKTLSDSCQVFAVTHLSPVASCADHHYLVSKKDDPDNTRTTVHLLDENERIEQLALISSGEVTKASYEAAEELYRRNHEQ